MLDNILVDKPIPPSARPGLSGVVYFPWLILTHAVIIFSVSDEVSLKRHLDTTWKWKDEMTGNDGKPAVNTII